MITTHAATISFDQDNPGAVPAGWRAGVTEGGRRNTLKYVDAPVPGNTWHILRVEFSGKKIRVILNGKTYIELDDDHIGGIGAVGVWTKADSVTLFDDFTYGVAA